MKIRLRGESQPVTLALIEGDLHRIVGMSDAWRTPVAIPMTLIDSITFNPSPLHPRGYSHGRK